MICPHIINISLLLGGILSWGLMWPLLENRKGDWYPADLDENNMKGLEGYKVCFLMKIILLFHIFILKHFTFELSDHINCSI